MKKDNRLTDILIVICIFLVAISFPIDLFCKDEIVIYSIRTLCKMAFVLFAYLYNKKYKITEKPQDRINRKAFHILPLFLICLCNMYFLVFTKQEISPNGSVFILIAEIAESFATSCAEEYLFRYIIHNNLKIEDKPKKILASAGIFGLFHIVNFLSSFNPADLITIVYAFGLGVVLGFMYEYTNNLIFGIIFHFLFNAVNNNLFVYLYSGDWTPGFYINAVIVSLYGFLCLLFFYIRYRKKEKNN